uniref:Uncharacterized protein n=1 Tax=Candidatus Methanophagaceae archaeon ANME-1 ERB6 TaxID=2759912 RepID=A0A7G9YSK0_9EURY|nr:hypothetical protein LCGFKGIO_00017 [Methanosarcinales archaeon ANME-1 ERB6]
MITQITFAIRDKIKFIFMIVSFSPSLEEIKELFTIGPFFSKMNLTREFVTLNAIIYLVLYSTF